MRPVPGEAEEVAEIGAGKTVQQCRGCRVVSKLVLVGAQGLKSVPRLALQLLKSLLFALFEPVGIRRARRRFEHAVQDSGKASIVGD